MNSPFPGREEQTFQLIFDNQSIVPIWKTFEKTGKLKILSGPHKVYKLVKIKGHRRVVFHGYEHKAELL